MFCFRICIFPKRKGAYTSRVWSSVWTSHDPYHLVFVFVSLRKPFFVLFLFLSITHLKKQCQDSPRTLLIQPCGLRSIVTMQVCHCCDPWNAARQISDSHTAWPVGKIPWPHPSIADSDTIVLELVWTLTAVGHRGDARRFWWPCTRAEVCFNLICTSGGSNQPSPGNNWIKSLDNKKIAQFKSWLLLRLLAL